MSELWWAIGVAWGLVLFASFAGWGVLVGRAVFPGARPPFGLRVAWGIGLLVAVGGVVSLAHAHSRALALGLVGAGVALNGLAARGGPSEEADLLARSLRRYPWALASLGAALAVLYAGTAYCRTLHAYDDHPGYAVYAERLLQEGTPGDDPFNERRMVALGGHSFLQSLVWCLAEPNRAARLGRLLDPGVGLLATAAALLSVAALHGSRPLALVLILLLLVLHPADPYANTSSTLVHAPLIAGVYATVLWLEREADRGRSGPVRLAVSVALPCAALVALKSTLVPQAVGLLAAVFAGRAFGRWRSWPREAVGLVLAGLVMVALLVPWMVLMDKVSGTPLYPLLGRGYHGTSYGTYQAPYSGATPAALIKRLVAFVCDPRIVGCWAGGALAWVAVRRAGATRGLTAFLALFYAASCLSMLAIYLATNDTDGMRYTYGTRLALVGAALAAVTARGQTRGLRPAPSPLVWMLVLLGGVIGAGWDKTSLAYQDKALSARDLLTGHSLYTSEDRVASYRRAQAAVPAGAPLLVWLDEPFLLDFRRNRIAVLDFPHGASPPPGMPAFRGSEALADYLRGRGIRYLLIGAPSEVHIDVYRSFTEPTSDVWHRTAGEHALEFYKNVSALRRTRAVPFDDGRVAVLDLCRPAG